MTAITWSCFDWLWR